MRACAYAGTTYNIRAVRGRDACGRNRGEGGCVPMPEQRRLAIFRSRVPNLNSAVTTAAGKLLSIGAPCHRHHTVKQKVSTRINRSREKTTWKKNLPFRVAGQRRLAISRSRVPNLDSVVITAAGNLLSIGAPRHREDTEIVGSQDTNQQKQRGKNRKKLTRLSARSPSTGNFQIASPKS